ncbi:MAG: C4-type zinc ribbon domain-containing protein [Pseudomonadota bacterium]|nr:C4-type zinc ribbon domain-containing protein [Pseudomonadota bacterium]
MENQIQFLWRLQVIDLKLSEMQGQEQQLDIEIDRLKKDEEELAGVMAGLEDQLAAKNGERRNIQAEIEQLKGKVEQSKIKLTQIQNNKEYFAALKEIESSEKEINRFETGLLELLEEVETLQSQMNDQQALLTEKREAITAREAETSSQIKKLSKESSSCQKERKEIIDLLDKRLLARYDRIRRRFSNAVVYVEQGTCTGCHVNVPPQVYINLLKGDEILNCPNCQRIMYSEPETESD